MKIVKKYLILIPLIAILSCSVGYVARVMSETPPTFPVDYESYYYEDQYYKLLVALTSPSLLHFKYGSFAPLTPNQTIYSAFYIFVRYAGLTYNYVDVRSPPNPLYAATVKFTTGDTITAQGTTSSFFYVTQASVDAVSDAKTMWFRRLNWLQTTTPTRIVIEEVDMEDWEVLNFTVGTYGSIVTQYIGQAYKLSLRFVISSVDYQIITNIESRYGSIGVGDQWSYCNGEIYFPCPATIDGTTMHYQVYVNSGTDPNITFKGYGIWYKYDLPDWWEDV